MSIQLDPVELGFKRPFTQEVTEVLRLRNPNSDPVAFKVKTTAPKQYCVRPNSGRIEAGQQVEVQVLLQAMKEDPPLDAKCRDKFLVQSVAVPANQDFTNVATLWSSVEQTAKSSIQEKKIRVNFIPASGAVPVAAGADATPSRRTTIGVGDEDASYDSPMSNANTPAPQRSSSAAMANAEPRSESANGFEDVKATAASAAGAAAGAVTGAAATVASAVPSNQEELKKQLASAQAQLAQLKDQASQGLRQRNVGTASSGKSAAGSTATAVQQAPAGVSVPIVAALCLISFLLAYLLF